MEDNNKINSESDCEQFFSLSSDIMVIADPNGAFKRVNPACLKVLGYSEDEILSKPFIDFVYPDDKQSTLDEMARQIKIGYSSNFENRYICKNGKILWFSWHSSFNKDKGVTYAIARDITEHKRLEEELLKASGHRYKALFLSSRDAIMTLEPPEWKFTSVNPATIKLFGASSEGDLLYHEPWVLSPLLQPDGSRSDEKSKEMIEKAMKEGSNFFEWTHKRLNGDEFPTEVLLSKVEQNSNTFLHAVVRDISERKKIEEKIKEVNKELETKINERTEELSNRIKELESFNKVMIGRELKMVELKKENEELMEKIKKCNDSDNKNI